MTALALFDPGEAKRDRPRITAALEDVFPSLSVAAAAEPGQAARRVRAALHDGHLDIIAVGGDRLINAALNGFFERGHPVAPEAVLGFIGIESDIGRGFGIAPGWQAGIAHLRQAHIRKVDIGRVACLSAAGEPVTRCFLGAASFGLSARIAARKGSARFALARQLHILAALAGWHECRVRLIAPGSGGYDEIAGIASVTVANARYGGGAELAPDARPNDGLFDLVVTGGGRAAMARALMSGAPPEGARRLRTARLMAAPTLDTDGPVPVETDGDYAGVLPATFEIYPNAINLRV